MQSLDEKEEKKEESPVELVGILCNFNCRVSEKSEFADGLFLIRTDAFPPPPEDEWPEQPSYWFVEFDERERPLKFQKLFHGYLEGTEPKAEGLWSTFQLVPLSVPGQFRLAGREPSPSGTAWGRSGEIHFTWPDLHFIGWTYSWFHALNGSQSGTISWDWRTASGSREFPTASFDFIVPRFSLDDEFRERGWKVADFSSCSAHLTHDRGHHPHGKGKAGHGARAVLSEQNELFVELIPDPLSKAEALNLKVCFSGEFERAPSPPPNPTPPPCVDASGQLSAKLSDVRVRVERSGKRLKLVLPEYVSDLTLIIEDPARSTVIQSSPFDFKNERSLGPTASFEENRVSCELADNALVPRFSPFKSEWALMDQTPWL